MRRTFAAIVIPFTLVAAPAMAQESAAVAPSETGDQSLDRLAETLADPARQQELASTLAVLSEVLLDLPLAPLVEPLAKAAGDAVGEEPEPVDPEMTLRRMAPQAGEIGRTIENRLPGAMNGMASMAKGLSSMLPALEQMRERMKDALPETIDTDR